ncbi:MAG: flagellar basal-body MS-ring/collar protein FliF [Syntrophobacterales bacterium]|nr:flagellar basal-body MS-ring/collar protein FliF [Syntrophobacterales bacterium]
MALNRLSEASRRLRELWGKLTLPQRIFIVGSLVAVLGSLAFVLYEINKPDYALLYGNIPEQEMASIVEHLKQAKIPYRIEESRIFIPREHLYEVRLSLAKAGIPKGGGIGFEIFDEQKLGSTEFVQKVNYQRALQGELARTIAKLEKVEDARVHLSLPEESLFVRDEKPPSAAIVIKVKRAQQLTPLELQGIVHLVSSAVKGLTDEHVTIMSTDGQVLFKKDPTQTSFELSELQLRYKQRLEEELQRKIQSMLAPVIGEGGVISRVTLDLDFNHIKISEEMVDPDSATPRSQQRIIEKTQGGASKRPKGNPDVPINVESKLLVSGGSKQEEATTGQSSERQEEIVNYELNKTIRQVTYAPGTIKRLSVAVLVDGPYREERDKKTIKRIFVGRSPDELRSIEEMVKKAVGYNDARGDQVSVTNIAFAGEAPPVVPPVERWLALAKEHYKPFVNILLILMVFLFIVRPILKQIGKVAAPPGEAKKLPPGEEVAALPPAEEIPKELSPRERAVIIVKEQPEKAVEIIRAWLREEGA